LRLQTLFARARPAYAYLLSLALLFSSLHLGHRVREYGIWMLILGQPQKQADGSKAPMWGRVVVGAVMVLGLLQGLMFAFVF